MDFLTQNMFEFHMLPVFQTSCTLFVNSSTLLNFLQFALKVFIHTTYFSHSKFPSSAPLNFNSFWWRGNVWRVG